MGIILSALAAAGDSGVQSMNQNIEQQNKLDLEDQRSQLETQKALAIAQATNNLHNQPLNDYVTALAAHQGDTMPLAPPGPALSLTGTPDANAYSSSQPDDRGLVGNISNMKAFALSMDDGNPDKQPLLAQIADQEAKQNSAALAAAPTTGPASKDAIIQSAMNDLSSSGNGAAYAAGIGLQNTDAKIANMQNRLDYLTLAASNKDATNQQRNEMMGQIAQIRAQSVTDSAQLRVDAANERALNGGAKNSTLNSQLNSETQNVRATTALIGTLTRQLPDLAGAKNNDARKDVQDQIEQYKQDIENSKGVKNLILKQLGMPTVDDLPKIPKITPSTIPGLPAGAVQIGTSGGKAVYQLPDGSKVKAQ